MNEPYTVLQYLGKAYYCNHPDCSHHKPPQTSDSKEDILYHIRRRHLKTCSLCEITCNSRFRVRYAKGGIKELTRVMLCCNCWAYLSGEVNKCDICTKASEIYVLGGSGVINKVDNPPPPADRGKDVIYLRNPPTSCLATDPPPDPGSAPGPLHKPEPIKPDKEFPPPTFARTKPGDPLNKQYVPVPGGPLKHESEPEPTPETTPEEEEKEEGKRIGKLVKEVEYPITKDGKEYIAIIKLYRDRISLTKLLLSEKGIVFMGSKELFSSMRSLDELFEKYNSKPELVLDLPCSEVPEDESKHDPLSKECSECGSKFKPKNPKRPIYRSKTKCVKKE